MNVINKVTLKAMRKNKARTLVTVIGIILSAALFTSITTLAASAMDFLIRGRIYEEGNYHAAISMRTDEEVAQFEQNPNISAVSDLLGLAYVQLDQEENVSNRVLLAAGDASYFENMPVHLTEGRLPQNSREIVLSNAAYSQFFNSGIPCDVGNTVALDLTTSWSYYNELFSHYDEENQKRFYVAPRDFTQEYTIVGIGDIVIREDLRFNLAPAITLADGEQGDHMWHHCFVQVKPLDYAYNLLEMYSDSSCLLNTYLLLYQGAGGGSNEMNQVIYGVVVALCAVVMLGSISLIYNSFSISVTQRTKQFGLLSSIGATRHQIRNSVFYEATILCIVGVPLGLLLGWCGTAAAIAMLGHNISPMFSFSESGAVQLSAVFSIPAIIMAVIITAITVFLSAWIPAKRAMKVAPIESIRQSRDYTVKHKTVRSRRIALKLFGVPGMMAANYYRVSKKSYRTMVISLALSVVLFVSAMSVGSVMQEAADANTSANNFDFEIHVDSVDGTDSGEVLANIRDYASFDKAAYRTSDGYYVHIEKDMYTEEMLAMWEQVFFADYMAGNGEPYSPRLLNVIYLEDVWFEAFLRENGIDPEPYFSEVMPTALICNIQSSEYDTYNYHDLQILRSDVEMLVAVPHSVPDGINPFEEYTNEFYMDENGLLIYSLHEAIESMDEEGNYQIEEGESLYFLVKETGKTSDGIEYAFYAYDPENSIVGNTPLAYETVDTLPFRLGARISNVPFGVPLGVSTQLNGYLTAILPLSAKEAGEDLTLSVSVANIADYYAAKAFLDEQSEIYYQDYLAEEIGTRGAVTMINLFSYVFILLISIICVCNVFNTISTNIALRRKDFGVLKSIGMQTKEMYQMIIHECALYGSSALLWGIPTGFVVSFLIHIVIYDIQETPYQLPMTAMLVAIFSVFIVVVISMLYAVRKLEIDNPIEAIRSESN